MFKLFYFSTKISKNSRDIFDFVKLYIHSLYKDTDMLIQVHVHLHVDQPK